MLKLKKFDVYGQVIVIVLAFALAIIPSVRIIIPGYFVVGGWQVLSMAAHLTYDDRLLVSPQRKHYQNALKAVFIIGCVAIPFAFLAFLVGLLFVSPFLAIWYAAISYAELRVWKARAWVHLK